MPAPAGSRLYIALCAILVLLAVSLSAAYFRQLPETVPIHWGGDGTPDRWATRPLAVIVTPSVMIALAFLFGFLPKISPAGFKGGHLNTISPVIGSVALSLCLVMHWLMLKSAEQGVLAGAQWADVIGAVLLVVIGVSLKHLSRNYFIGVRNPWTLSDAEIWERANGLGAWTVSLAGLAVAAVGIAAPERPIAVPVGLVFAAIGIPTAYSLLLWLRKRRGSTE